MSDFDDLYNVTPNPFSEDDADRLISGDATATRHSGEAADLGHLVHIARGVPTASELANQASFLSMFAAEIRVTSTPLQPERKRRMIKFFSAKHSIKFVSIVAGVVFSAGAAAAATGSLPDPAQQVVSDVVSHIGIDVPSPNSTVADPAPASTTTAEATTTHGTESSTSAAEVTVGTTQTTAPATGGSKGGESKDSTEHDATTTGKITFGASEQSTEPTKPREKNEASGLTPVDPTGKTDHASLCQAWIQQHDFKTGKNSNETALHNVQQAAWAAGFTVEGWCGFSHGTTATLPPTTTTTTKVPENHDGTTTTKPAVTSTTHVEPTTTTKPAVTTTTHVETTTTTHVEPTTTSTATTTTQAAESTTTSSTP